MIDNTATYNPCDDCKYGVERRNGSGNDAVCKICEFRVLLNRRAEPKECSAMVRVEGGIPYCADRQTACDGCRAEPCHTCTGIMYRQTASGKIIPADKKCAVMEPPPCYQPDGDGCAYQIYGDSNDEPIDRCKACPLCYSDKARRAEPANEPLTCEGCEAKGQYENEVEYGYPSPCTRCKRRSPDNYRRKPEPEGGAR